MSNQYILSIRVLKAKSPAQALTQFSKGRPNFDESHPLCDILVPLTSTIYKVIAQYSPSVTVPDCSYDHICSLDKQCSWEQ